MSDTLRTQAVLDRTFKGPQTKYELAEFENLGKPIHRIVEVFPKKITSGREAGKFKYFIQSFVPFSSGKYIEEAEGVSS